MHVHCIFFAIISVFVFTPFGDGRPEYRLWQELSERAKGSIGLPGGEEEFSSVPNWLDIIYPLATRLVNIFSYAPYKIRTVAGASAATYDYIVVGAGAGGSVLASRLSENSAWKILVIEAGGEETAFSVTPAAQQWLMKSYFDWKFTSEPQTNAAKGLKDKRLPYSQGRAVGGSSAIYGFGYLRGNAKDYDKWAELGAKGWAYKDILPLFIRSEGKLRNFQGSSDFEDRFHGTSGPLPVSGVQNPSPTLRTIMDGIKKAGFKFGDYNGSNQTRFNYLQANLKDGRRCSAGCAFLGPASQRSNLDILLNATVQKIIFDSNKVATSVEYRQNGRVQRVMARKEIILCAGVFNTPKLLMLSGVGPKDKLQKLGIKMVLDAPGVGENFQDHFHTVMSYQTKPFTSMVYTRTEGIIQAALQYAKNRTGGLAGPGVPIIGFVRTSIARDERPDVTVRIVPGLAGSAGTTFISGYRASYTPEVIRKYFVPNRLVDGFSLLTGLYKPLSVGHVRLKSANPLDDPIIDPRLLSDPKDVKALVEGCKIAHKIAESAPVRQGLNATPFRNTLPGCEKFKINSDAYFECLIRTLTLPELHGCCTAKMGPDSDRMSVTDSQLRVKGVKNLRIMDASVMPEVVNSNTYATVVMIAEKGADMIKKPTTTQMRDDHDD